jgi:hypothetical protein
MRNQVTEYFTADYLSLFTGLAKEFISCVGPLLLLLLLIYHTYCDDNIFININTVFSTSLRESAGPRKREEEFSTYEITRMSLLL